MSKMTIKVHESRKLRESDDDFVGKQKFTYGELKKAWDELNRNIENDPEDKKYPPAYGYDVRGGYDTTDDYAPETSWAVGPTQYGEIKFSLEAITKALENVEEPITAGDLEVYWLGDHESTSDEHGILIKDGEIVKVY